MGLYHAVIAFLQDDEAGNDESVYSGLNDIQRAMVDAYSEAEHISKKASREQLHL